MHASGMGPDAGVGMAELTRRRRLCTQSSLAVAQALRLSYLLVVDLVYVAGQAAGEEDADHREHGHAEGRARDQAHIALYKVDHAVVAALRTFIHSLDKI